MASTLTVDNIVGATTAANVHIPGHVIQVVRGVIPTTSETISSTSYAASSLYVAITPKSSTSGILLVTSVNIDYSPGANASLAIHKNGTIITAGSTPYDGHAYFNRISNSRVILQQSVMAYDSSVGTTSAVTYKLYGKQHTGNFEIRHDLAVECLVAMEIAQ